MVKVLRLVLTYRACRAVVEEKPWILRKHPSMTGGFHGYGGTPLSLVGLLKLEDPMKLDDYLFWGVPLVAGNHQFGFLKPCFVLPEELDGCRVSISFPHFFRGIR